jgi:hypothetical protein
VQDLEANDMTRLPWFVKRYAERLPRTPLPRELPATTEPAVAVLAGPAEVKPTPLDLPNLPRLLYLSAGVRRRTPVPERPGRPARRPQPRPPGHPSALAPARAKAPAHPSTPLRCIFMHHYAYTCKHV